MRHLLTAALGAIHIAYADGSVPSAPLNVALDVLGPDALAVAWEPPATDGGSPVSAYLVEWDPDPGMREVQVVQTSANTGANEVQTVQTYAKHVKEIQRVTTSATAVAEVQTITTSAAPGETLGGVFTIQMDSTKSGGSVQRSGVIGFNAPASGDRSGVLEILNAMSNIGPTGVQSVQKSMADAQGGITWTIMFSTAMGDVPQLTLSSNFLTGSGANVVINTPKQGNVIDGGMLTLRFKGSTTKDLASDISDAGMQKALEDLASIESVDVTRGGPDAQHGYYWDITFTGEFNSGDLPLMTVPSKSLKATGANAVVTERTAGNQLKGSFQLSYKLAPTGDLPFDCSAATMKSELEKLGTVGTLDVVRTEKPDLQGGYTWTISFLTLKGSLDQLGTDILKLGETRTDGAGPSMGVRVVRTRPGTVQEVQQIQVTTTNSNVKKTASFQLQTTFAGQTLATNPIFANPMDNGACMPTQAEVQKIAVTTVDTTATGGDAIVSKQAAIQLVYTSNTEGDAVSKTGPIYLDKAGDGDCAKGATTIAAELNNLPGIIGPVTVSSSALLATHECTWQVTFTNQPGNVVQLKAIPASSGATASDTVNLGDDTITLTTVTDGTTNMIKTELERLANVAQVTVTATTGLKQTCTWSVTFDGNAGNLPLMTVSTNNGVSYGATGTVSGDTITIVAGTDGTSTVLGGVFALEFEGQRTGYMPFDASEAVMQTQLETLSTIGSVAVTRSGADPNNGYAWMVSFLNNLGNLQPLQPDALALTGTSPKIDVTEATKGALPPFNSKDPSSGLSFDSVVITDLSDLSVTAYHVDENVPFYFRVSAINAAGRGPPSYSTPQYAIPTAQVPSVPTNVSLSAVDGTTVAVYMSSPENDGGASLDSYRVEYSTSPIVDEVQQIRLVVPVTNEVQTIRITTDTVGEVQLIRLISSYSGSPASEIQQVNCDADSSTGTFTLTFGGETTAPIPASQTDVLKIKAVLEELNAITTVTVAFYGGQTTACRPCPTSGCTSGFKVTFTSVVGYQGDMPLLTGNTFDLEGNRRLDVTESTKGQAPVSGTFKLTYLRGKDADTVALQYNAPAATVQAALVALDSSMMIVVTDGTLPPANAAKGERLWRVTFQNSGYVPDMLVRPANNLLQGNGAGILVYTRSATPDPTVPVSVGGNRVSGYFKVKLGGHTTERISHDASDTTVKSKLEALPNVGTVSVTRSTPSLKTEYSWTVTFTANPGSFPIGAGNIDTLVADSTLLRGTNSQAAVTVVQQGSLPLDGTFKLSNTVGGVTQTTAKLSPYDTGEGIQRALETLPSIGGVSVSRQTNSDGFSWFVTFSGCRLNPAVCNIGDVNLLDKVATSLVGGLLPAVPSVTVTEVVKGVAPATTLLVTDLSGGDPFQTVISSLTYGTKYYARVYWHNSVSFGHRAVSVPEFVTTKNLPPGPPWPVTLVSSTATSITVAWEEPTVNGGATVSGYELWISEWAESSYRKVYDRPNDAVAMQTTLQTSADNVIESGHKYSFKVRAVNFCSSENTNAACYGAFSEPVEYTVRSPVVPDPPVSLTRDSRTTINTNAANDGIVFINWTPPKDNGGSPVTSYKLFMDDGTGWALQTLIGSFPHGYTHKSPVLALVVANVPSAPSAPSITEVSATAINVAWQPPATCTSTLTGCNGSPLLGYRLWQFAGVAASYTASGSPVNVEIQRIRTTVSAPVPEIQSVTVVGASGKFKLYVNSQPTPLLSVSATDLEVQTAVATCGVNPTSVTHTATATGRTWAITFALADGPQALMVVVPDQLTNTVLAVAYTTSVTRVQLGTAALGGDFTVSFRGFETGHLSVTTTDKAEMKRHLENLPSVGVVDVTTTAGPNNAMTWDVTFVTELGDLPLIKVTSGRLTGGNPNVQVTTIQEGTPGRVVYDGATAPDILSFKSTNLVSDTLYAFVVVAINAAGDGISGISTPAVAASPGAASSYTEAYGPALLQGMAGIVYEVQSVKTNGLTGSFTLQWGTSGPSSLIDTTTTASALEAMLPTTISSLGAVHVSRADLNGADCVWYVTFVSVVGDAPMLVSSDTTHVQIDEFVKGEANEFTIAPRKASGDVVTYATLPANFQGKDRFWTELWASPPSVIDGTHEFVSEGGLAVYNPVVYEIQTLRFNGVVGTFRLKLDTTNARVGGVVSTSTAPLDAAVLAAASDAKAADLIKTNLETLTNIESVLVSRVSTSGAAPWTYSVTFVTDLCDQPPLELVGDSNFMASATVLTIKELQDGVCEVQTVTTSASVESTAEVQSISTWLDATGSTIQLGGSFSLTFTGMGSITVPYNANAAAMKNLLESLNGIDDVSVTVKSANYGTPTTTGLQTWTVTFNEIMGKVPDIKLDLPTALTGSSATVLIKEVKRMGLSLGGTFVLNFMGGTTHNLPFDIEAAGLKTELQTALSTVREVDVRKEERYNGNRWTISFTKNLGDLPLLEAYPYAYEIQEITTLGGSPTPLEGTFTLSFLTETTAPIAYDVSDVAMKLSLQALPSIGLVDVTRTDKLDPGNRFSWQVTFRSSLGNIGTLVADDSGLTGSFSDVSVTELQPGNKQSLSGQFPQLAVFKKQSGLPSYTARYIPYGAADNYSVSVQQLLSGGLFALYFDNFWLQDEPAIVRVDPQLNFDWGQGAISNYGRDYISIRWFGKLSVPTTDTYVLYVSSSEGVRVWLNHQLRVDTWEDGEDEGGTLENFSESLTAGTFYDLRVEYHEATGVASFKLSWSSSFLPIAPIPTSALFHGEHIAGSPYPITVTPGATDFPYTTAFGSGLTMATAGVTAQFIIQAKDQNDNNKTIDGDAFDVEIKGTSTGTANGVQLAPFEEHKYIGQGQYLVRYLPSVSGTYTVSIQTVNGIDIYCGLGKLHKCSPFALTVRPGPATPHTSQALGNAAATTYGVLDGLIEAVAGLVSNFTIQARDTYANAADADDVFETKMVLQLDRTVQYRSNVLVAGQTGLSAVEYSIPRAGRYEIQTYLNGIPILMCPGGVTCWALNTPAILTVVHSFLHGPSCTVDDTATGALSTATSGGQTSFKIYARDTFGNLRKGDRTTHSLTTGDGRSDAFLVTFTGKDEVFRTSTAVQTLTSADKTIAGYFKLSFGKFRKQLCPLCVNALAGDVLSVSSNLVGILLPGTKFVVQECIFTAASLASTSVTVVTNHGCAAFTSQNFALQVAASGSAATDALTPLIPHDVSASGLRSILQDLHGDAKVEVSLDVGSGYQWKITFLSHLLEWSEAHLAVEYTNGFAFSLYAHPLVVAYTAASGVYPVWYTPHYAGSYTVAVTTWDRDTHVKGSPFTVQVADGATHGPSTLTATGDWRTENYSVAAQQMVIEAGKPLSFQVQLKDTRRLEQQAIRLRAVVLAPVQEVQRVLVDATPFTLSFRGSPATASLTTSSSFGSIRAALEALSTISSGGVTVTPENPADMTAVVTHAFLVTFTKATGSLPLLVSPNSGATVTPLVRGAVSVRQEMQILTCTSAVAVALAGSFSVSFQGRTPVDAAASDTLATFSSTLTTLVGSSVSVVAEGGLQATVCALTTSARLLITFNQVLGDVAPLVYTKPAGSQLTVVGEDNTDNTISGIYPAWGSFTLALPGRAETTVTVTRDWFDITTETATAKLATLVQWTVKFDSHAGNMPELVADYSGISVHDDGQRKPFVETLELVRGSSKFTLTYGGVSTEITPDASLEELEKQLNAIPAGVQLYATSDGVRKSAAELSTASMFFPVCSVANPRRIEIVFKTPTDVPLIAWSLTGNDMYITEAVKGVVPSETAIKISNLEVQKLQCQVTAAAAATASFDLLYAGERITVGANAVPSALQTQLNDMKSILQVGGVDVTSTSPQVCTDPASSVDITFRKVGDQLSFVLAQIRDGILLAQVTETTKGLDSLVYDGSHQGLFNVTATPVVSGTYAMGVTVLSLSTNFCPLSFQVRPTLASGGTSTHTAPAVVTQGVTEWFTLQAVDRFNNLLESSTELGTDAFVAKLLPPSVASTPAESYPVSITESNPNTNGIFSLTFLPQRAGTYTLSLVRRQAGGLWATYYATAFFTDSYLSRQDAAVSFQWGETSPLGDPFPNRNYSIRWRGELRAVVSGLHVFTLRADNAVKLVVDGLVLLDLFATPAVSSAINKFDSLPIELKEGRYYSVEISYRTKDAQSFVKLEWSCQMAGLTRTAVPSASLFTSTELVNTPFSIVAYPGMINSTQVRNSFDGFTTANVSGGPIVTNALDPITFVLEAHDSFGNRRFHSGSDAFEVSMVGVDGWASAGRINDVTTKSAVQYDPTFICKACAVSFVINTRTLTLNVDVASQLEAGVRFRVINANSGTSARRRDCFFTTESVSGPFAASAVAVVVVSANGCAAFSSSSFDVSAIAPTDWNFLGTCSAASGSTSLTTCTSVFGLKRGDQLTVGREANSVHYTAGVLSTVAVPLEQPYRGASSGFVPVFKAGDTTGRHTVSMVPYVKGVYRLSVRLPAIDAVHAVITQADSALGGSFYLSVAGKTTGSLSFAALDTDVKTALEALSTVGVGNVATSVSCTNGDATKGCRWLVTFRHLTEAVSTSLGASYNGVLTGNNAAVVIQTLTQPRAAQMVNGFPKNVRVNPGVMNPTVSTAYGSGLYASTSGVLSSFFVQMKDTHGNNLESDTNYLQVQVFPAGTTYLSSQVAEVSSVAYVSEGLYKVSYMPVLSGRHTVVVTAQMSPEVHKVSSAFALPGTSRGGTFVLRLFSQTTAPLVFEANATDVQQALLNLPVFAVHTMNATTAITVTRAANNQNGFDYLITYTRLPPDLELRIVQTVNNLYSGDGGSGATLTASLQTPQSREHVKTSISLGEPIVNEQQIVTVTSTAALTGGSFQLKFGAHTTDLIPYNAPATTLEDLLNKLPSIGTNGVSVSLTTSLATARAWTVTFLAATAGTPQTAFWNSALYTPNRIVRHARLVGDIPGLTPTSTNTLVAGVNPDGQVAVTTSVTGVSPFTTIVAHGALVPTQCTAVDGSTPFKPGSVNAVGQNGLHSGRFHSRSSFVIEARDTNGNLLDGTGGGFTGAPVQELQVVETFSSAGPGNKLTGSFALVLDGQKTAALPANAGLQEVEAALEALKSLSGFVTVDTPDVQTVKFAAELGDLSALAVDTTKLGGGTGTGKAKVTACDYLRTQQLQTAAASQISGDFSLSFRGSTTPMLPWNVDASTLRSALETLDGIHAAAVSTPVTGTNGGFTWQITLVSTEPQGDNDLELLYAEGYLLLGKQARIQVTPVCPSTKTRENMNIQSVSGSEGHAFVPVLRGASTVVADVSYLGGAAYQAVYDTPREATYSLDVRYVSPRGLMGSYFDNRWQYGTPTFERVDPLIDFMWKEDRITPTSREHVSVRWQGYIKPSFSEDYVFFVLVNDGARLWIENQLVIDQYDFDVDASTAVEFQANASVALIKDRLTGITLEYRENSGVASVSLLWQSHTQPKRIVPSARLFHRSDAIMKSPFSVKTQGSKPSPPLNISLTISAADALTVHFSAPDDDGGAPVTGYQVEWWTYAAYGSNEVQVLKIATSNTGGTFTLTLDNGQTTGPLPASALYSDVEVALEALDGAGDVTVIPAPSANSRDYTITFNSRVGSVPDIQVDATQLTGSKAYMVCSKGATQALANGMQCIASESITSTVHLLSNPVTFTPPDVPKRGDPYTFVISGLTQPAASVEPKAPGEVGGTNGPGFSVRVLAKNSAGNGLPSATAYEADGGPAAPTNVESRLVAGSSTSLRLWWDAPTANNGAIVTFYVVEWCLDLPGRLSSDPFSSFREKPGFFLAAHPTSLRFKYTVDNLVPGAAYVIQVRAENVMGVGQLGKRPASSSIPTAASCTSLLLSWLPVTAADAHGAAVRSYIVDWYQPQSVDTSPFEVQILQIFGKDAADVVTGTFRVQYSGTYTEPLPVDVSEYELEESLEALPALRSVEVERTPFTSRGGYQWAVTFLSEAPAVLGKVLSIDTTKLTATILTTNVGAQLAAPVGSSSITVAAIQGSNQVTSTDTAATGALADMYISTSQGLWRVTAVSVVTGTVTLTLSGSFYGANGNYPAQLGWTVPGALPADYHSKTIPASNATDTYSLVLDTLPPGTPYSARVSACNSLGCNAPTMASPLTLAAPKQKPATPLDVALFADSGSTLRVRWRHPPSDGGNVITHYRIEWDPKRTFDSGADTNGESSKGSSFGYEREAVVNPGVGCLLTPCEAVIGSLERGAPYYVRVYAYNSFGYSIDAGYPVVPGFGVPKTLPEAPVDILLTPMQSSPDRGLTYQIEWDAMDLDALIPDIVTAISSAKTAATISTGLINRVFFAEHTTQLLLLSATAYDVRGSFRLAFQDAVTVGLPWDITSDALAAALETLPTVGRVNIRRVAAGFGFAWFVTFLTTPFRADTSTGDVYGDIPLLKVSTDSTQLLSDFSTSQAATSTLTGTGAKLATATLIRAFNGFEQQMVKISTSAGALGGFFSLSYNQQQTASMPANASAIAVKQALTQITDPNELVGDVDVYKRQSATPTGFVYTIVYKSRLGPNRPLVGCIDKDLTSSVTTATKSCDTTRTQLGGLPAMNSDLYGVAIVNKTDLSVRDDGMAHYDVQGLRRGVGYHVRVSAWNGVGNVFGSTRASTPARFIVQSVPDAPRDVSVEPRSPTKLLVSWTKPLNTGGTTASNYTVQIAARRGVAEQQLIKADSSLGDLSQRRLVLQLRVGDVSGSTTVLGNVSSDGLRSALANALNVPGAIAHVSRNSVGIFSGYGYEWVVTFSDSIGDVSLIEVTEASYESSETSPDYLSALALSVTELVKGSVDGSSMNGAAVTTVVVTPQHEVQRVFIYSGSPVDLGGTVMLSVGGESTAALAVDTTSEDVRVALEGLSTVGQVSVTVTGEVTQRASFPAVRYGVYWDVTFSSTTDDLPLLGVRTDTTLPFTPSACGGTLSGVTPCVEALTLKQGGLPTQTTLSQLTNTSNYVVRLTASNEQFTSKFVTVPGALQPVARPPLEQNAQVASVAVDTLDVMWQAPLGDGGARVVHYKVQWDVSANFDLQSIFSGSDTVLVKESDDEMFDYRITGLSSSKDYFVSVVAYNARGHGVPVTALPVDAHERVTHLTVSGATLDEVALATETMTLSFANYPSKTATVGVASSALELQSALQRLSVVGVLSVKRSDYSKGPAATPYDTSGVDTPSNLLMTWSITFLTASVDGVRASALGALTVAHTGPTIVAPMEVVSPIEDGSLTIRPRAVAATGPRDVRVSIVDAASLGVSWLPSLSPLSSKYLVEWSTTPDFAACRAGSISSSGTRTNYATAAANSQVINALPHRLTAASHTPLSAYQPKRSNTYACRLTTVTTVPRLLLKSCP
ncbi:Fibronectin type III domain [Phytophthora infestans]|uniref:Fibronectin type III domain n=1 Tax=Phytophthora infestans TaxID=4787 RepID=A0A833SR71_PHYIN|nr:Fibronectin type III domain [Phytophthora infestans]